MLLKALKHINARGIMVKPGDKFSVNENFGKLLMQNKAAEAWKDKPNAKKG